MVATQTPSSMSASSGTTTYGDLETHPTSPNAWRPNSFNVYQYLTLALPEPMYVVAIDTRGYHNKGYYVETYTVEYFNDTSRQWEFYKVSHRFSCSK